MNKKVLHNFTLNARQLLISEVEGLLEAVYGFHGNGTFESIEHLPVIREDENAKNTRTSLEKFVNDEHKAGLKSRHAYEKLVKEVAFTWLNRFIAFKMMEVRRLIRQTITKGADSNGFKMWLTQEGNEAYLNLYEKGDSPKNAFGEGPRDTAYRHFILWQCSAIAKEIKVLFDPDNLASLLFPRPRAINELIQMINAGELQESWQEGNEETIGWVYQYFNEPELAIFHRQSSPKVPPHLIAAKTQQFTPRWIVRYLVQNTLGRLWVQMHPDTCLREKLDYLVPVDEEASRVPVKPVREIKVLDPACGTMHFGLVAFDFLFEMYREELKNMGKQGWPARPSVSDEEHIPAAILEHNLFGIDIDLRAVQLSALALYLKAKSVNKTAFLGNNNLACADVLLLNGERLQNFFKETCFSRPVYERVVKTLWNQLKDAGQIGSLLRLEDEIQELVTKEKERYNRKGRQLDIFGESIKQFEMEASNEGYWKNIADHIVDSFNKFTRLRAEKGQDESYFAGEATKGLRLLDVMFRQYDVVVTNPPYLDARDYNPRLKSFLERAYPISKRNLYAAFLERCLEFLGPGARLGIITPQTFMFISSFAKLREHLRGLVAIESLVHTGLNTFEDTVVDCAFYVLRSEADAGKRQNAAAIYFRLVKEPDAEAKRRALESAVAALQRGECHHLVYRYRQGDFDAIPGSPWVYWITPGIRRLFMDLPKMEDIAQPCVGLQTGDNFRFLRFWWEVGRSRIAFGCRSHAEAQATRKKWFPYMKGGAYRKWYGNQEYVVNWDNSGEEIKAFGSSVVRNSDFYFREGVTWTDVSSAGFGARYLPYGFIFDVNGSSVFPPEDLIPGVLAVLNSKWSQYALAILNPTVHFQVGDIARISVLEKNRLSSQILSGLVQRAIMLRKQESTEDETAFEFIAPLPWVNGPELAAQRRMVLAELEQRIDEEIYCSYGLSEDDRQVIDEELLKGDILGTGSRVEESGSETDGYAADENVDREPFLEMPLSREELAIRWVSYAVGVVMGRFVPGVKGALGSAIVENSGVVEKHLFSAEVENALRDLIVPNAIAVLDPGHQEDLAFRVKKALTLMLGEDQVNQVVIFLGGDINQIDESLRSFLKQEFFKIHLKWYRKRPVFWLLQSPEKNYSLYVYYERMTRDTLFLLQGNRYLGAKINATHHRLEEVRKLILEKRGRGKKQLEKELAQLNALLNDLEAFDRNLRAVLGAGNDRNETVGWTPEIDDGVIVNLAPLHELIPSWKAEPEKHWEKLKAGDYDWSYTAMRYWPGRVFEKCKTTKSFAIAHGLLSMFKG